MNILKIVKQASTKEKLNSNSDFIMGKDETLKPKFTSILGTNYAVNIYYLKVSSPELNLEKKCININLPMSLRKNNNQELLNAILQKMYTKITENVLENMLEKARHSLGFAPENYEIQKLQNSFASCNKDLQTITFSPYISMYSKEIIEYIVFHEFCHLKYKNHTQKFYELLSKYIPNYEKISKSIPNLKY